MANEEHLVILKQGVEAWNKWRRENPDTKPDLMDASLVAADLIGANLSRADLIGADLSRADLIGANLSGADLSWAAVIWANLSGANLSGADLSGADLRRAGLRGADLRGAELTGADLRKAGLRGADLRGANVERAMVGRSVFADVDLSEVKGLDMVKHHGPSSVGIDTIYKSKGKIPEVFLRECGVPDAMITFIASLAGKPETNRIRLRMMIHDLFNEIELQDLCFDMGVDYEDLKGESKLDKARQLVLHCERRQIILDLVAKCRKLHPKASWEGDYE